MFNPPLLLLLVATAVFTAQDTNPKASPPSIEAEAQRMSDTVQWALARAKGDEMPSTEQELGDELKRTREAVLALHMVARAAIERAQAAELRRSSDLAAPAMAYMRRSGWSQGQVKRSVTVEERFGSTKYWVIELDSDIKAHIVKDGGLFGWSRMNPDRFWAKSDWRGFTYLESSGSESSVSDARLDWELEQKIRY